MTNWVKQIPILLLLAINPDLRSQSIINGQVFIDTTIWSPIAFLSIIPDFDYMNAMSNQMIIDKSLIDSLGNFSFQLNYLPKEDHLFRIHIPRKGDPSASLIIGGNNENHFFLIANKQSRISIRDTTDHQFVKDVIVEGYAPNISFQEVNRICFFLDSVSSFGSSIKSELFRSAISEQLCFFADTCTNPVVALYALYKGQIERRIPFNQNFYKNFLAKWKNEQSPYIIDFRKRIQLTRSAKSWFSYLLWVALFAAGFTSCLMYSRYINRSRNLLKNLSIQERRIFCLITEGKSNKEISELLKIGLSTVKSHINNIYSKLNITSRKEVLNMNLDTKNKVYE